MSPSAKHPMTLQSLSLVMLTFSVIVFAADGLVTGMPMFMLATVWIVTALAAAGIYFLFTVLFVVFDNWCCYPKGSSFDDYTLGRCTVRTASIIHTPGLWHKCDSHSFTRAELIGIGVICGLFGVWLLLFIIRIILIKTRLHRLVVLERLGQLITHPTTKEAYLRTIAHARLLRTAPDFRNLSHPALLYRVRFILLFDPMSILFGYCAVAIRMPAWHVLLQVVMSMIASACALSYWLLHKTVWMWWILIIFGGLATAVLLIHHLYMATVMIVYVHMALNEVVVAYNRSAPSRLSDIKKMFEALKTITHNATTKLHKEALSFTHPSPSHEAPWRPPLTPREWTVAHRFGSIAKPSTQRATRSILRHFL